MKIAVPVHEESLEVFVRVGRAPRFAIYEDEVFVAFRSNNHTHEHDHEGGHHDGGHGHGTGRGLGHGGGSGHGHGGRHDHDHDHAEGFGMEHLGVGEEPMDSYSAEEVELHRKDLENLADVDTMLCRAVGPNMKGALELVGIDVVKIRKKDGESADEVVRNFLAK